jgi:hypothetical protein
MSARVTALLRLHALVRLGETLLEIHGETVAITTETPCEFFDLDVVPGRRAALRHWAGNRRPPSVQIVGLRFSACTLALAAQHNDRADGPSNQRILVPAARYRPARPGLTSW